MIVFIILDILLVVFDIRLYKVSHNLPEQLLTHQYSVHLIVRVCEKVLVAKHVQCEFLHCRGVQYVDVILVKGGTVRIGAEILETYFP